MRRNYTKLLIGILLAGVLYSCSKENIEIIKNKDTSWEVDESIINADVRTKLGYDPRYEYIFTDNTELEFPMLFLGNFALTGESKKTVEVKLLKPRDKETAVTLTYDASLYENIKEKYTDYTLGDENLVQITNKTVTIPAGEVLATFEFVVKNNAAFRENVVLPFKPVVNEDNSIKLLETKDQIIAKIFPKEVTYTYSNKITQKIVISDSDVYTSAVDINITSSDIINDAVSLSIERADGNGIANLAPIGAEGTLPSDIDFQKLSNGRFSINIDKSQLEKGKIYQLPLQIMAKNGTNSHMLPNSVMIVLEAVGEGDNVESTKEAQGLLISGKEMKMTYSPDRNGYREEYLNDDSFGRYYFAQFLASESIKIAFNEEKTVSSLQFAMRYDVTSYRVRPTQVAVYALDSNNQEVYQGTATITSATDAFVSLKSPIKTKTIILKEFKPTGVWLTLSEIDVFEKK